MRFDVITLFPSIVDAACSESILSRAKKQGIVEINTVNPRDFTLDKHKKVDDTPYGGGAGMVLAPQPFFDAYKSIKKSSSSVTIMLTPQGKTYNQKMAQNFSSFEQIILVCGHYEGFDERIRQFLSPDLVEISIGEYVLTGGELPALIVIDSVSRLLEGTLGHIASSREDTFSDGLLEYPQYTKPREYEGYKVPEVLVNGNHAEIAKWRRIQQIIRTKEKRPDLYQKFLDSNLQENDRKIIENL